MQVNGLFVLRLAWEWPPLGHCWTVLYKIIFPIWSPYTLKLNPIHIFDFLLDGQRRALMWWSPPSSTNNNCRHIATMVPSSMWRQINLVSASITYRRIGAKNNTGLSWRWKLISLQLFVICIQRAVKVSKERRSWSRKEKEEITERYKVRKMDEIGACSRKINVTEGVI